MRDFQMLLSGLVTSGLMRAKAEGYPTLQVEMQVDEQGGYLPSIAVSLHGERYLITVTPDHPADQVQEAQEAPRPPETGHYVSIAEDGRVFFRHPASEAMSSCEVVPLFLEGALDVAGHGPGRYAVCCEMPDLGDLDDSPSPRWYLDPLPDGSVVSSEQVRSFPIPLPVTLVSMPRSGETYVLADRWGWFWLVPPDGAGEPEHITEAAAQESVSRADWELVGQSFSTWEGLHWFRQGRAATLAPQRDDIPADHLVTVLADGAVEIQHPQSCRKYPVRDCGLYAVGGPKKIAALSPGRYRFYLLPDGSRWGWEPEEAVRGKVANG